MEGDLDLVILDLEVRSPVKVLITNGFRDYKMLIPEAVNEPNRVELFFCLPSYWDLEDLTNANMNWVFEWIQRIPKYVRDNGTWIGHGHTFSIGKDRAQISENMKEDHFIVLKPMALEREMAPLILEEEVSFLAIVPIFSDEWDYKQGKGTTKLIRKLESKGVTEILDDFRTTVLKSKWRIW